LSPNLAHDLTRLTEQLDHDAASLLPRRVPLGQATLRTPCRVVPMLNLASDNLIFHFHLGREPKPGRSSFSKKSKLTQNRNWILKRNLKDLVLNFKDPFVLKIDLNLQIHLFLMPSFYFYKRFKSLF
jgi:hypothetical protein